MKKIGEARHMQRVKHIYFQEEAIPNMISKKRHSFDQGDVRSIDRFAIVGISTVAHGQGMVNRNT